MPAAGETIIAGRVPGDRIATATEDADSSGITTTETTVMSVTAPLVAGRTYRVRFYGGFAGTVTDDNINARIREDNSTGTEMQNSASQLPFTSGVPWILPMEAEYTASATANKTFVATLVRLSGSGSVRLEAASSRHAYLYVDYIRG